MVLTAPILAHVYHGMRYCVDQHSRPPMKNQTPTEQVLLRPSPSWLDRVVGLIAMAIALLLVAVIYALGHALLQRPALSVGAVVAFAVLLLLTALFALSGHRLVFREPNRYGSLFAPWVWFSISATLLAAALLGGVMAIRHPSAEVAQGILSSLLLALLSYGAGSHFRRKARLRDRAA